MRKVYISLTVILSAVFVLLGVFVFRQAYLRFWETLCDFGRSITYYFCGIFGIEHHIIPTVTEYSKVLQWDVLLPSDFAGFQRSAADYFGLLFNKDNFAAWRKLLAGGLGNVVKMLSILLPCIVILIFAVKRLYAKGNNSHNKDTLPLKAFKKIMSVTYRPAKRFVKQYIAFLKKYRYIWALWLVLWAFHLNAASIVLGALAYYFYFAVSFDFVGLYVQVCKLLIDLQFIFRYFPWWVLVLAVYPLFHRWRKRIAVNRLRHNEAKNCGVINELPIVSITCGSMGKKKTTMITDMVLSQEVMFRQKALSVLQNIDLEFPYFPWLMFEKELQRCMEHHTVYNLASVKTWVGLKRERFLRHKNADLQLYGYDYRRYGLTYDDTLKKVTLFEGLETYALAYFIYVIQSSLIVSNYSVRTDNRMITEGNFPVWLLDFFPEQRRKHSHHAHILDFDVLRLGKKVSENNPKAGSFEFGVVEIT